MLVPVMAGQTISHDLVKPAATANPTADEIVERSIDRDWTDFSILKNYTYQQQTEFRQLGADGRVSSSRSETSEILILGGRRHEKLLARDGKPLSDSEARREQAKLDREVAKVQQESESQKRKYERERAENRKFIREVPAAFTFKLVGTDVVSGKPAWILDAEPKPDFVPQRANARNFKKVRARVWIEQGTYHWVKMDAQVIDTLSFGLGLVRIAPGGTVHFEQVHVNDEVWLPSQILVKADARLALLKKLRTELQISYRDYKKFQSDSRILDISETDPQ